MFKQTVETCFRDVWSYKHIDTDFCFPNLFSLNPEVLTPRLGTTGRDPRAGWAGLSLKNNSCFAVDNHCHISCFIFAGCKSSGLWLRSCPWAPVVQAAAIKASMTHPFDRKAARRRRFPAISVLSFVNCRGKIPSFLPPVLQQIGCQIHPGGSTRSEQRLMEADSLVCFYLINFSRWMCWWLNGVKTLPVLYSNRRTLCLLSAPGGVLSEEVPPPVDSLIVFILLMQFGVNRLVK